MTTFTAEEVKAFKQGGNKRARKEWLSKWSPNEYPEPESSEKSRIREFMRMKYEEKKWFKKRKKKRSNTEDSVDFNEEQQEEGQEKKKKKKKKKKDRDRSESKEVPTEDLSNVLPGVEKLTVSDVGATTTMLVTFLLAYGGILDEK